MKVGGRVYVCKGHHCCLELPTLPEHLSSPLVFSGVRIIQSLFLRVMFVDRCLSFFFGSLCCLSFDLGILITPLVSSNSSFVSTNFQLEVGTFLWVW
jgi:hypothetical protein